MVPSEVTRYRRVSFVLSPTVPVTVVSCAVTVPEGAGVRPAAAAAADDDAATESEILTACRVLVAGKTYGGLVTIDTNTSTVTGTIGSKSTENMLYLTTQQGDMELKLDAVRSVTNCKVLVEGSRVSIVCARGNDAYMHALEIKGA